MIGLFGISDEVIVANAGVITIRLKEMSKAKALYLYLLSEDGQANLYRLYEVSPNKTINPDILGTLEILDDLVLDEKKLLKVFQLQKQMDSIVNEMKDLLKKHIV